MKQENEKVLSDVKKSNEKLNSELAAKTTEVNDLREELTDFQKSYDQLHEDYR